MFSRFFAGKLSGFLVDEKNSIVAPLKILGIKFGFMIRHILLMIGFKSFGAAIDFKNLVQAFLKIKLIRGLFFVRHFVLMAAFKSYGFGVDAKNLINVFVMRTFYLGRHLLLMTGYKTWGFSVDHYNTVLAAVDQVKVFIKIGAIRYYFFIRHIFLMGYFKAFGLAVDGYYLLNRGLSTATWPIRKLYWKCEYHIIYESWPQIFKSLVYALLSTKGAGIIRILVYPFFKIYWFLTYQYKNRSLINISPIINGLARDGFYFCSRSLRRAAWPFKKLFWKCEYHLTNESWSQICKGILYRLLTSKGLRLIRFLMHPLFKIYWFLLYQYEKRIKKNI